MVGRCAVALIVLSLLALSSAQYVVAVSIGVNRADLSYIDVLQNGYAQDVVLVTTDSDETITGTYEFVGEIAPWLRVDPPGNFTFSANSPHQLTVIVEPPPDARIQNYTGGLRVLTGDVARTEGGKIGTTTRAAFLIRLKLGVTGVQTLACRSGGVAIRDTEVGQPFELVISVSNKGNVRIRPDFSVLIYDQYQTTLVANISVPGGIEILPTTTMDFVKQVHHSLPVGQYWARVETPLCGDGALITFDVLDRGGVADKGELIAIEAKPWATTGEIIPVTAVFKNTGSRSVSAKFKGLVTDEKGERIFKVIDTESYIIPPGGVGRMETFFNPTEPNKYLVSGRVLYNSKLTFQKSTLINVRGPTMVAARSWSGVMLLIIFIIIILVLLILIAKRRRERRRRHVILRR